VISIYFDHLISFINLCQQEKQKILNENLTKTNDNSMFGEDEIEND
jgi:hypothetical protein